MSNVGTQELRQAVDEATVRALRIMQVAMGVGVLVFSGFVLARGASGGGTTAGPPEPVGLVQGLSLANLLVALTVYAAAGPLFRVRIRAARLRSSAQDVAEALRGAWILRLALTEGSALFGAAVCYLAVGNGVLPGVPVYWANLLPVAAFLAFSAATFPTRERLVVALSDRSM
jgi:hypothetical protein